MSIPEIFKQAQEKMKKAVDAVDHEFATLRTGRSSVALVDNIQIEAYGSKMALKAAATISTPDAKTIVIQPFDKGQSAAIERALLGANLGMTPTNDGKVIRLVIPPMTEDRRKDLVKVARKHGEDGRVAVRFVRRHALEDIKKTEKTHEIAEDERERAEKTVQELTDRFIKEIDDLLGRKEKEVMEV